jgi:hypothetical protein
MVTFYLCFLAGGAVLPFISFAFGFLGNGSDVDTASEFDASADVNMDADLDGTLDSVMNTNISTSTADGIEGDPVQGTHSILAIGLLPTSAMALSTLAIVFGAVGSIMTYKGVTGIITLIVSALTGYAAAVIVQSFIRTLKKIQVNNTGVDEQELLLYEGTVVETILPGQLGTVSFLTLKNIRVSYPARCADEELRLSTGRVVRVIEKQNGIFIVEPKNKYE